MVRKLFGTDGVRGLANTEPITPQTVLRLAVAVGHRFRRGDHRHLVVIGKDTRLSGYMLEPALTAGFVSMGMDVVLVGPLPTPALAVLTRSLRADLGVVISASHNPYYDNGIKLFGPDGYKLSDDEELEIERLMEDPSLEPAESANLGRARRLDDAQGRYIEYVKQTFPRGLRLDGLRIVVDCANGAAYKVAPTVLWELGADVLAVGVDPDGTNINRNCGATVPDTISERVVAAGADLGIAFDGDADRVIISDENGRIIDGDQLMALIATDWKGCGRLQGGGVVATVMSNLGFERYLGRIGLDLVRVAVGDRYVVERMRSDSYNIGGEQSGHIILADYSTTGDGLIAALQSLAALVIRDRSASEVLSVFETLPQIQENVRFSGGAPLEDRLVREAIADGEHLLGADGRLVIRKSGTEPVIRVMAQGDDETLIGDVVRDIVGAIEQVSRS
ncbi:MAG: phosphoglucosamine mutase [Alphaproteobacteria bacterium]|nr:phosphoglucosamine mutase [Alphaproteobacteria bacterium]